MTSRFSGDIFYAASGGGGGSSRPSMAGFAGAQGGFQQQPLQNPAFFTPDHQIPSRRSSADLLMMGSKRSFSDFQSYHQQILFLQHQQQQQQQQQNQYLMRSVKPRTNHFVSSSTTRFGLPVYQQPINFSNHTIIPTNNNGPLIPAHNGPTPEDDKILNTLQELEKELLNDDDEDNQDDHDAVSVITNSEWSETFHSLMGSDPSPIGPAQNNNNSNNLISPSPTSSTSSCCSSSGTPVPAKQLIIEAATAISDGRVDIAIDQLARLAQVANPKGSSEQRLAFYMTNALRSRACARENPAPVKELYSKEQMSSMCALYDLSPCFKYGLLAANLVMLEAIASSSSKTKIHVVDFHVGHLGQYVNLVCALVEQRLTELRITLVETELENGFGVEAESMRDELMKLADRVGINLRFESVTRKIHELTRETLGCEDNESVVVNLAYMLYRVPDESVSMENLRDELLRRIKSLTPRAVTLVEQDMNANTAPFPTRVNEAWGYYGALLDSLEATLSRDSPDRARVEEGLGRKMVNMVAYEGRDRVERAEVFGKWRARMGMAGFEMKALPKSVAESMRAKLNSGRAGNPGFTVKEEGGGVGFGWMGRTLTVASCWR